MDVCWAGGEEHCVAYVPGESDSGLFGGNSNWRGPVWFPVNFLLVEALERYHHFFGDSLQKEYIRRPAFSRLAINPLRDFRQRPRVGINPYVELLRMLAGRSIHESTVAGPDIDCDSAGIRRN